MKRLSRAFIATAFVAVTTALAALAQAQTEKLITAAPSQIIPPGPPTPTPAPSPTPSPSPSPSPAPSPAPTPPPIPSPSPSPH